MKNEDYFKKIKNDYQSATEYSSELYKNIGARLNSILAGTVVDIGNGGVINYSLDKIEKLICIDVIFEQKTNLNSKIECIYGDFYNLDFYTNPDCVLIQFLLHHLCDDLKLKKSLREINKNLRDNGKVVVVEILFPRFVEFFQNLFKGIIFIIFKLLRKPQVRFFSRESLTRLLADSGLRCYEMSEIPMGKKVSPAPVLFPKLRIPGILYPFRCVIVEARCCG